MDPHAVLRTDFLRAYTGEATRYGDTGSHRDPFIATAG